jgi:hypothetical protein
MCREAVRVFGLTFQDPGLCQWVLLDVAERPKAFQLFVPQSLA